MRYLIGRKGYPGQYWSGAGSWVDFWNAMIYLTDDTKWRHLPVGGVWVAMSETERFDRELFV